MHSLIRSKLLAVICLPLLFACFSVPPGPGQWNHNLPGRQLARIAYEEGPYGRNGIACYPTGMGAILTNGVSLMFGWPAYLALSPIDFFVIEAATGLEFGWEAQDPSPPLLSLANDLTWLLGAAGGMATGTLFVPFSFLAPEAGPQDPHGASLPCPPINDLAMIDLPHRPLVLSWPYR
jgi:hypothetical protein